MPAVRAALLCVLFAAPAPAFAYLDPGTGSMLIQSLLAIVAAVLVFGRTLWARVRDFFRRGPGTSAPPGDDKKQ